MTAGRRYQFVVARSLAFADIAVESETAGERADVRLTALDRVDDFTEQTADADAVFVTTNVVDAARMAALGGEVRAIGRIGIGLDAIDLPAARDRGLAVVYAPGYATAEVATHTAALILTAQRRIVEADVYGRGAWKEWTALKPIAPIDETTLGLVGAGRIGAEVARLMRPFVKRILTFDPYVEGTIDWAERVDTLDALLISSDIVSLHLPLSDETRLLIDAERIASMRPGAILVNTARGLLLDSEAAAAALDDGHLGVVAVDVLESEQPEPDHPLLGAPRTIITPHMAWYSERAARNVRAETVADVIAVLDGGEPVHGRRAI